MSFGAEDRAFGRGCAFAKGPAGQKTNPIFKFRSLEKGNLLLKKFISPKTGWGVLFPLGREKRLLATNSSFGALGPAF